MKAILSGAISSDKRKLNRQEEISSHLFPFQREISYYEVHFIEYCSSPFGHYMGSSVRSSLFSSWTLSSNSRHASVSSSVDFNETSSFAVSGEATGTQVTSAYVSLPCLYQFHSRLNDILLQTHRRGYVDCHERRSHGHHSHFSVRLHSKLPIWYLSRYRPIVATTLNVSEPTGTVVTSSYVFCYSLKYARVDFFPP